MKPKKGTLFVSGGIVKPDPINPDAVNKFRQKKKKILKAEEYADGIRNHDRTILSQAITLIESSLPSHRDSAARIIEKCLPLSGNSLRIGITGVPGVGKSTFIETLGTMVTGMGRKLAVLAIDPSSKRSGGSILGDKTRMESLARDPDAFIRPSPSGGSLGGVARKTKETIILCEAAGFDTIFVETTGVGQSETAVHSMVDFFLLLMLAGAGDELQGIKRGIMEIADAVVITKADGSNIHHAEIARTEFTSALHLYPPSESGWIPKVMTCSAKNGLGLEEVWNTIMSFREFAEKSGYFQNNRNQQAIARMFDSINESLRTDFYNWPGITAKIEEYKKKILKNRISSYQAAQELLDYYLKRFNKDAGM